MFNKNPLFSLESLYKKNKLGKYDYIEKIHNFNKVLYYFSQKIPKTDIKKIEIIDNFLIFTTRKDNIKLTFNGLDRRAVPYDILNFRTYEEEDQYIIFNSISKRATIFDIGSNIGWYSLLFSKRFPQSKIYSFEPIKETFNTLLKNIQLNNSKNIIPINCAISNTANKRSNYFYFPSGSVLASKKNLINCEKAKKTNCKETTIDMFIEENKIKNIEFIKCDVEGGEFDALKGGVNTLKNNSPIILAEIYEPWCKKFNYKANDIFYFLHELGYKSFLCHHEKIKEVKKYKESKKERLNFLFFHKISHKPLINIFQNK